MADAAVEFLLNNLRDLLVHQSHLIADTKSQIEGLERDLRVFRFFLKDLVKKRRKDATTQALVRNIRDVVYEVEDVIDEFVTKAARIKTKYTFFRAWKPLVNIDNISKKLEEVTKQIQQSKIDIASLTVADEDNYEKSKDPAVSREKLVGFEDVTSAVIGYLTQETDKVDVITLVGMPGIGKTTLAQRIFNHPRIKDEFPFRIWVQVSNEFTKRNVFLTILREFNVNIEGFMDKSEKELADLVFSRLESTKFLIVLDDVWAVSDWDTLGIVERESNIKTGKVLITSCNEEVGRCANRFRQPHSVRYMSESESWELLQLEVFGETTKCPPELETVGKLIAKQCDGLPLAIVTMGGVLVRMDLSCVDIKARKNAWIRASQNVPKYRNKKFYDNLPSHLQLCFLYLAVFPYDFEIPVGQLICKWIAEGFIEQRDGFSLEETAESYLKALIDRNLLKVDQRKANGKIKTCRIHRMLHDFCKTEAGNHGENVLTEMQFSDGVFEPPISDLSKCRRLSIHSNVLDFISSKPSCPCLRSLVSFSKEKISLPVEDIPTLPASFILLRVLDVKPILFTKISSYMYQLVHLRYLALSLNLITLPAKFSLLRNIQTFLVDTTSPTLEIEADIFGFTQLRHFKTNASASFMKHGKNSKGGENLQSLGTILVECCTEELFKKAPNLKKLGIRGQLALFFEGKVGSYDKLASSGGLENLKLLNGMHPRPHSASRLNGLPQPYKFPPGLRSLTLAGTFLEWSQMSILGLLEKLEVLKLKDNAFVGRVWEADDGCFCNLEALHIGETDLVIWVASANHFPRLRSLKLRHCEQLQEVPIELADIPSLQLLDLFETKLAADSANRFLEKKHEFLKERSMDAEDFTLSIYPKS